MAAFETILCDGEFESVSVLDSYDADAERRDTLEQNKTQQLQAQLLEAFGTIDTVVSGVQKFSNDVVKEYKKQIVSLSVQIAEKILAVKIEKDGYDLTEIITKALDCVPKSEQITVFLNSDDLEQISRLQSEGKLKDISAAQFKADPALGKAECRVVGPKGIVNSIMKDHLENINRALEQVV